MRDWNMRSIPPPLSPSRPHRLMCRSQRQAPAVIVPLWFRQFSTSSTVSLLRNSRELHGALEFGSKSSESSRKKSPNRVQQGVTALPSRASIEDARGSQIAKWEVA